MIDAKTLKKLAATCRKAGIKHYKCAEFEFTLEEIPAPTFQKASKAITVDSNSTFKTDSLSPEELLFWSSSMSTEIESGSDQ